MNSRTAHADATRGIAWWNNLSPATRAYWLERAQSAVPAHAWHYAKLMRELHGRNGEPITPGIRIPCVPCPEPGITRNNPE